MKKQSNLLFTKVLVALRDDNVEKAVQFTLPLNDGNEVGVEKLRLEFSKAAAIFQKEDKGRIEAMTIIQQAIDTYTNS
jgi:hypothetical protein